VHLTLARAHSLDALQPPVLHLLLAMIAQELGAKELARLLPQHPFMRAVAPRAHVRSRGPAAP
jgi:hypothetical protein